MIKKKNKLIYDKILADVVISREDLDFILVDLINRNMLIPEIYIDCPHCKGPVTIVEKVDKNFSNQCPNCGKIITNEDSFPYTIVFNINEETLLEIPFFRAGRDDRLLRKKSPCVQ